MANKNLFPDGGPGKGYKPPYAGHEAMKSCRENSGINCGSSMVGSKSVKEGKKSNLHNDSHTNSEHGDRGYKTPKVKGSK